MTNNENYDLFLGRFKEVLRRNSLKYTKQREIILEAIYNSEEHFTPESLYGEIGAKHSDSKIGIATIYRTLSLLEKEEMVTSISFGANGKKYEAGTKDHHDHMICDLCGKIIEFFDEEIEELQDKVAKNHSFKITDHVMQIHGICSQCQEK
jgi:Fur family ferric uptake transcriptional regulator